VHGPDAARALLHTTGGATSASRRGIVVAAHGSRHAASVDRRSRRFFVAGSHNPH
jgi:hypothetical protein